MGFGAIGFGGVTFANVGQVFSSIGSMSSENLLPAVGAGVRIRLTEDNNLNYSIDIAYGRDGVQYYFSIGESF